MLKLTQRQEKIVSYFRANGTLYKGRYAIKRAVAYKCAQFFELTVLQNIGTITYSPEQGCYYVNAAPSAVRQESWDTSGTADYVPDDDMPDVKPDRKHGHWHTTPIAAKKPSVQQSATAIEPIHRCGTNSDAAEEERLARARYFDARHVADELRASARTQALTMAPGGIRQLQNSVERFYEAVEIEARRGRELFDLLADQSEN